MLVKRDMNLKLRIGRQKPLFILPALALLMIICLGSGWMLAGVADSLSPGEARTLLQHIAGADFKKDKVQIKKISPGAGSGVIVEALVETAFRFDRDGRNWKISEMRLGDRHWESLDLIEEAVRREKIRRTTAVLERLVTGLAAYKKANGEYVVADDYPKLLDKLAPQYFSPIIHFDFWGTPLIYRGMAATYRVASAGPDRLPDTADDIVLESGTNRSLSRNLDR